MESMQPGLSRGSADTRAAGLSLVRAATVAGGVLAVVSAAGIAYAVAPHATASTQVVVGTQQGLPQAGPGGGQGPVVSSGGS